MAPKVVLVNAFFEQLLKFLTELRDMYPDDADFSLGVTSIRMMRTVNPSMVVKFFYDTAKPYEDEILTKNEKFFLDHSFNDIPDVDFNILAKLKEYVINMSDDSKRYVWMYVDNLFKLAKVISST